MLRMYFIVKWKTLLTHIYVYVEGEKTIIIFRLEIVKTIIIIMDLSIHLNIGQVLL